MKTTVAIVNKQGDDFSLEEVEIDGPRDDEILVRIVATGLCHTDIHLKDTLPEAMFPMVFGHEGSGVVEAVGPGVAHHVEVSLRPDWIGGIQYRKARLHDGTLELGPAEPILLDGELRTAKLV